MGNAKAEVPRWRRKKQAPGNTVVLRGRAAREYAKAHTPAVRHIQDGGLARRSGLYRHRYQLVPLWWLLGVLAVGMLAHAAHAVPAAALMGAFAAGTITVACRHLSEFARHMAWVLGALTVVWVPVLAATGWRSVTPPALLLCYAVVQFKQAGNYKVRPLEVPEYRTDDYERWNLLADAQKWNGHLGPVEALPGGGRRYPIQLDGIKTTMSNVLASSDNVAGAWHAPMTEAYAERDSTGIPSRGYLTILGSDTLMRVREWNGAGIDPATGMAVLGRYADGAPVHMKFYTPRYGTRCALISGTTGSGKTELLNLLVHIALASGNIVPVIMDPQEGQSLPFWQDRCLYAAGEDACHDMTAGLHAGMLDRSRYLAGLRWDDDGVPMRGMPFFDAALTGLPIVLVIFDEAHMPLAGKTKASRATIAKTVQMARLIRKTGGSLILATHIPGLSDLGGEQALRDMLRGGGVVSMRTANRVASGMLGLSKDPSEIPPFFTDGKETYGLGYAAGPDNRPDAPMRTDLVPKAAKRRVPAVPALDDRFREAMEAAMPRVNYAPPPAAVAVAAVPLESTPPDAEGRTAADAILAVVNGDMDRGTLIKWVNDHVVEEWGREPFAFRTITTALEKLVKQGKIRNDKRNQYAPARVLHVVGDQEGPR